MRLNNFPNQFKDLLAARKISRIDRYQLENTLKPCFVATHSYWVLVLSIIIRDQAEVFLKRKYHRSINYRVMVEMATFHDFGESVTGDVDHIAKRAGVVDPKSEVEFISNRFEQSPLFQKHLSSILLDTQGEDWGVEKSIVKCADILEHLIFCYEEQELFGNKSMCEPLGTGVKIVHKKYPELYANSKIVEEITDSCGNVVMNNPLANV